MRNIIKKILKENEWDWAMDSQPLELQDPETWVGKKFGYGQPFIDIMYDYEIERGDDKEFYEIVGVEGNSLLVVRNHPRFGRGRDATKIYIVGFIDHMNEGEWVWV